VAIILVRESDCMQYKVNAYVGDTQVNSAELVIGKKVVYEVLNKYLRDKRNSNVEVQSKTG